MVPIRMPRKKDQGNKDRKHRPETEVIAAGRDPARQMGIVNPAVYHASTVIFETLEELESRTAKPFDGAY